MGNFSRFFITGVCNLNMYLYIENCLSSYGRFGSKAHPCALDAYQISSIL